MDQQELINALMWQLIYADNALAYLREHYPTIYAETSDSDFLEARTNVIADCKERN